MDDTLRFWWKRAVEPALFFQVVHGRCMHTGIQRKAKPGSSGQNECSRGLQMGLEVGGRQG
jgi:hypothetical protein